MCNHAIENSFLDGTTMVSGLSNVIKRRGKERFDDYMTTTMFDHYFRHLYTILRFISENEWLGADKQYKYATFVRATLSRYELIMLYYNGFFHPKMKKMMEQYCLLNNIRKDLLPMSYEYYVFYVNKEFLKKICEMLISLLVISNIILLMMKMMILDIISVLFL